MNFLKFSGQAVVDASRSRSTLGSTRPEQLSISYKSEKLSLHQRGMDLLGISEEDLKAGVFVHMGKTDDFGYVLLVWKHQPTNIAKNEQGAPLVPYCKLGASGQVALKGYVHSIYKYIDEEVSTFDVLVRVWNNNELVYDGEGADAKCIREVKQFPASLVFKFVEENGQPLDINANGEYDEALDGARIYVIEIEKESKPQDDALKTRSQIEDSGKKVLAAMERKKAAEANVVMEVEDDDEDYDI